MTSLLSAVLFFLPAGVANMSPVLAARLPWLRDWQAPIDFGKSYRGQRIFGANKTWRGLGFGTLVGGLVGLLEFALLSYTGLGSSALTACLIGAGMGFGALAGDAVASFFKRQRGILPGHSWFPIDQLDYIIGGLLAVAPFTQLTLRLVLLVVVLYFGFHLVFSYMGYRLGLKDRPI